MLKINFMSTDVVIPVPENRKEFSEIRIVGTLGKFVPETRTESLGMHFFYFEGNSLTLFLTGSFLSK